MYDYEKPSTGSCIKAEVSNAGAILEDAKNLGRWGLTEGGRQILPLLRPRFFPDSSLLSVEEPYHWPGTMEPRNSDQKVWTSEPKQMLLPLSSSY